MRSVISDTNVRQATSVDIVSQLSEIKRTSASEVRDIGWESFNYPEAAGNMERLNLTFNTHQKVEAMISSNTDHSQVMSKNQTISNKIGLEFIIIHLNTSELILHWINLISL